MGIFVLEINIMGVDVLGVDILAPTRLTTAQVHVFVQVYTLNVWFNNI